MARQNINVNPTVREFEAYMDFSGGINTETSNERLADNEFLEMVNVDLSNRGSVKKRTGYSFIANVPSQEAVAKNVQGMFFFYREGKEHPDIIFAREGRLYVKEFDNPSQTTATQITVTGLKNNLGVAITEFQKDRIVEGVQFLNKLYVASGTDLIVVEYISNAWTAKAITPYQPIAQELKFIGKNSLLGFAMENTNLTASGVTISSDFDAKGVVFSQFTTPESQAKVLRNGVKGQDMRVRGYIIDKTPYTGYNPTQNQYVFYYRKTGEESTKTATINPSTAGQTVFSLPGNETYEMETNSISVFVNNAQLNLGSGFTETNERQVTLNTGVNPGQIVKLVWQQNWIKAPATGVVTTKTARVESFGSGESYIKFRPLETGLYDFKFEVIFNYTVGGTTTPYPKDFIFNDFEVKAVAAKNDVYDQIDTGIKTCNRIRLHFNRLMLFGDTTEPTQLYFSHLDNPAYFPTVNMIRFDTGKKEPIITVERIQNYLTVFTKTTIHSLTGINPSEFSVNLINDSVGCIAERSAVLTNNVITFLSQEGVYILKPATFKLDQLNVQRVDADVKSQISKDTNVCATAYDSQYYICYPDDKLVYRYYFERESWVKDKSERLNFAQFLTYGNNLYVITQDGKLLKRDNSVYKDDTLGYNMIVETKYFDLSKSFNFKKLKKLYVLGRHYKTYDAEFSVSVYSDAKIVLDPEVGSAIIDPITNVVSWNTTLVPNVEFPHGTTFGVWEVSEDELGEKYLSVQKARVRGKCHRVKIQFLNTQDKEVELFGFGLEFKLKKP
jgi:hypothetical protein